MRGPNFTFINHALIKGKVRRYHICDRIRYDAYFKRQERVGNLIWLGKGIIVKINGKKNVFTEKLNFWRWTRKKRNGWN